MPFSLHSHSGEFCLHAQNTLEEMVQAAIRQRMRVFALTEHIPRDQAEDLYPEEKKGAQTVATLVDTFDRFYHEAHRLQRQYRSQIDLLVGFESEWIRPSSRPLIQQLMRTYSVDVWVGSVHHVRGLPIDYDRAVYEGARELVGGTDEAIFAAYYDAQFTMLQELQPPVVGHLDLIRLKSDQPDGDPRRWPAVWAKIVRNLDFIAGYGGVVEINAAALRKGMAEPYPKREISQVSGTRPVALVPGYRVLRRLIRLQAFLERGGRFTLSDDSHAVEQVGSHYLPVLPFLRTVGITMLYYWAHGAERGPADAGMVGLQSIAIDDVEAWGSAIASPEQRVQ
ncbi:MAG: histidinolphosphatase [Phylliscum demangeonii]|nr:MAG: histidinolphosphatase [Phylliscum demangeonii]